MAASNLDGLAALGWGEFFAAQVTDADQGLLPARVCRQDVNQLRLLSAAGPLTGQLAGRLRKAAGSKADLPTVGDWVLVRPAQGDGLALIERRLERRSSLSRKEPGLGVDEQLVASNLDTVFIVSGLDADFNPARIARYLVMCADSGAEPVLLLNKLDLCGDFPARLAALVPVAEGVAIHPLSALHGKGLAALGEWLGPGDTAAFIGSSGTGKSTIINWLLGETRFQTGAVRAGDSKGRHTTSFRELAVLPSGGVVVDTPGLRELQVWTDEAGLARHFGDLAELAAGCRFNDCGHDEGAAGCALTAAVAAGEVDGARLGHYRKLAAEVRELGARQEIAARRKSRRKI